MDATADTVLPADTGGRDATTIQDVIAITDAPTLDGTSILPEASSADVPSAADATHDAGSCDPAVGTAAMTSECDQVQLAILRNGSGATAAVFGRINIGDIQMAPCAVVDSIDVVSGGTTIATIPGTGTPQANEGGTYLMASGTANGPLTALCALDTGRFDGIGLVVHGRVDGGTFTSQCGDNTPDVRWPPSVVVTCHSGLQQMPLPASDATVMSLTVMGMALTTDQIYATIPQPPVVMSVDATVHLVPGVSSFSCGPNIPPSDTTGWTAGASTMMDADGSSVSDLTLINNGDVLGSQLCPAGCTSPPCAPTTPPVFLARINGTTDAGPFESELYVSNCFTE